MNAVSLPYRLARRDGEHQQSRSRVPGLAPGRTPDPVPVELRCGVSRAQVAALLAERQFTLAFQPVLRLSDRGVVAHEALLRLRPPPGLAVPCTGTFVELAVAWGLGAALDAAVLEAALVARAASGGVPISVNITAASLHDPTVLRLLLGAGPSLAVELSRVDDPGSVGWLAGAVVALQRDGVRVALDDLGAEEASLACVRAIRFDTVKIAGPLLHAAVQGTRGRHLLRLVVALAVASGADTVAKRVETLPQAWLAQELGIGFGQGWLFGAPRRLVRLPGEAAPAG